MTRLPMSDPLIAKICAASLANTEAVEISAKSTIATALFSFGSWGAMGVGGWVWDAGYWVLDVGRWVFDVGCWAVGGGVERGWARAAWAALSTFQLTGLPFLRNTLAEMSRRFWKKRGKHVSTDSSVANRMI